jgi:hypothetical protein
MKDYKKIKKLIKANDIDNVKIVESLITRCENVEFYMSFAYAVYANNAILNDEFRQIFNDKNLYRALNLKKLSISEIYSYILLESSDAEMLDEITEIFINYVKQRTQIAKALLKT